MLILFQVWIRWEKQIGHAGCPSSPCNESDSWAIYSNTHSFKSCCSNSQQSKYYNLNWPKCPQRTHFTRKLKFIEKQCELGFSFFVFSFLKKKKKKTVAITLVKLASCLLLLLCKLKVQFNNWRQGQNYTAFLSTLQNTIYLQEHFQVFQYFTFHMKYRSVLSSCYRNSQKCLI